MKFAVAKPAERSVKIVSCLDLDAALRLADLTSGEVDFGTMWMPDRHSGQRGLSVVVYEFGLLVRNMRTRELVQPRPLLGFRKNLLAGNAVFFSFNEQGDTVELAVSRTELEQNIIWLPTRADAERAIAAGLVSRPVIAINGRVLSSWPNMVGFE